MTASTLVTAIGWTLVDFLWQGALVGCITAVGLIALRNARPQQRYLLAAYALLLCLFWPAAGLWNRVHELQASGMAGAVSARLIVHAGAAGDADWLGYVQGKLAWIVGAWALCAAALGLRMGVGLLWIGRMTRGEQHDRQWQARLDELAARFGITRALRLRIVDGLASPVTAGWLRPVVLVPASLVSGMPPNLLEALLAHELAHVSRYDYLVNLGQNVVETLLFYHPAVWWISNRIRIEREQIADDLAARAIGEPRRLALALSELERLQFSSHHLAQAANGGDLISRIKRLVRPDTQALNWKAAIPVLGLIALCAGCAASRQPPVQSQQQPPAPQMVDSHAVVEFKSCAKPVWPVEDLQAGHEGTVTLGYLIGADGNVVDSVVRKSSGYPAMDEAARSGIAKCHFKPATRSGEPVQAWMKMQYVWLQH
jgi:D-alanyl-D-alanine endopeptidase (penicillin-binding protein 7)